MEDKLLGIGGDDELKYSKNGRFHEVVEYLNTKFTPAAIAATKADWTKYVTSLGGDAQKHTFGRFAAYLMEGLFAQDSGNARRYPTKKEWIEDCTTYNGQPIDPVAFKAIADALRENLQQDKPFPMQFTVVSSDTPVHEIVRTTGEIAGARGVLVTIKCPARPR
jgi:hypothetical protein